MEEILVFGHKSPDTDSICSSIVMEYMKLKSNENAKAYRLGGINKETEFALNYFKVQAPPLLEKIEKGKNVILVDHNEFAQSVERN